MSEIRMGWRRQPGRSLTRDERLPSVVRVRAQEEGRGHPCGRRSSPGVTEPKQNEVVIHLGKQLGSGCQGLFQVTEASVQTKMMYGIAVLSTRNRDRDRGRRCGGGFSR